MFFKFKETKVIILGLNYLSFNLARKLSVNRDVVILYNKNYNIKTSSYNIDVIIEKIKYNFIDKLKEYLEDDCVIFISLTGDDEYNIFTAQLAKNLGAKHGIACVRNNEYLKINIDIDYIFNPLQIIIDRISTELKNTEQKKIKNFIHGKVNITQIKVKNEDNISYKKFKNYNLQGGIVIAINRGERMLVPHENIRFLPDDILYILYKRCFTDWIKMFKSDKFSNKKIFIIGSGKTGKYFINYWQKFFETVIVIEPELEKCNKLATRFEKPLILHGEITDLQLLREEGINNKSVFLASSQNDFYNLLASYGASKQGCNYVITLLNKPENMEITNLLKLDKVIFKPDIISDYIISYLKTGFKKIDKHILGKEIYTARVHINRKSRVKNTKLKNVKLPDKVLIGVIIRDNKAIIPSKNTELKKDDIVIVFFDYRLEDKISGIFI